MNLYDVLAGQGTTHFERLFARYVGVGNVQTITGIPPLPFKADGTPLISWSMLGNGQQTGTPSPQSIIMPTFCGVRTANLFPLDATKLHVGRIGNDGTIEYEVGTITVGTDSVTYQANATWRGFYTDYIQADENATLTFSPNDSSSMSWSCICYDENDNFLGRATAQATASIKTFTTLASTKKVRIAVTSSFTEYTVTNPMLNAGNTALHYEPYGWAEKITNAGQTTPVYLGQTQTVRRVKKLVLTGDNPSAWTITEQQQTGRRRVYNGNAVSEGENIGFVCTHYAAASPNTAYPNNGYFSINASGTLIFGIANDGTKDEFMQFLAAQYAAGTPVTVWYVLAEPETAIVNEPLAKIGTYADELHSTDAGVTIPTVRGSNTLTVYTDLQPSEMTITYKG